MKGNGNSTLVVSNFSSSYLKGEKVGTARWYGVHARTSYH
jgi:hypothetical protein